MKLIKRIGVTSEIWQLFVQDNSVVTGAGLSSLSPTTTSVLCYYKRNTGNAAVQVTLADMTLGAYTSGGLKAVANMPGVYDFCPPDAALATGASSVAFLLYPATTTVVMAPLPIEVQLTQADLDDATDLGLSNLDAAMSTRLPTSSYVAPDNTSTAAIKAKTDQMTFTSGDIHATLDGESVAVGSYATTTAAPLQPTVAGRTLNVLASGESEADLQKVNGLDADGNNATLKLKSLDVTNNAGDAVIFKSTGGNGRGFVKQGNGSGEGDYTEGGATAHGSNIQAGATGGDALLLQSNVAVGLRAFGGTGQPSIYAETIQGDLSGDVTGEVGSLSPTAVDSIWDEVLEGALTARKIIRGFISALLGKSSGHTAGISSPKYRDQADTKDRISATTDADGNRTAVTLDLD